MSKAHKKTHFSSKTTGWTHKSTRCLLSWSPSFSWLLPILLFTRLFPCAQCRLHCAAGSVNPVGLHLRAKPVGTQNITQEGRAPQGHKERASVGPPERGRHRFSLEERKQAAARAGQDWGSGVCGGNCHCSLEASGATSSQAVLWQESTRTVPTVPYRHPNYSKHVVKFFSLNRGKTGNNRKWSKLS